MSNRYALVRLAVVVAISCPLLFSQTTTSNSLTLLSDFQQKLLLAVISAILGFLASYGLDKIKKRREPRKELSYDLRATDPLVDIAAQVTDKVQVFYATRNVRNIYYIAFDLENTGNMMVQDQFV